MKITMTRPPYTFAFLCLLVISGPLLAQDATPALQPIIQKQQAPAPALSIKLLSPELQKSKEVESLKAVIVPISKPSEKWDVLASDVRLATTFERWAQKAGWRIQWDAARHFLIDSTSSFNGTFEEAITAALMTPGIRLGAYPLEACIYANTPPLIRITRQGEQSQECPGN